jgi:NTP pyrophosphatase (non-canonical NTP hydrolase)
MRFSEYQEIATQTDQVPFSTEKDIKSLLIPLLGLAGESGSLLTEYKKRLRDGDAYKIFHERISEEIGDILWYLANIATKEGLNLQDIAQNNLIKTRDRWHEQSSDLFGPKLFDDGYPENEKFPRCFEINVVTEKDGSGKHLVQLYYAGEKLGDPLTDNAYEDDGYRLHDVFHLSFLATLGWSPVMRKLLKCKRYSAHDIDENEDGGRANVIDEAITALIFIEAKKNSFFEGVDSVDYNLLRTIKDLTAHLEASRISTKQWQDAILKGFEIWRQLKTHHNGIIKGDLIKKSLEFFPNS